MIQKSQAIYLSLIFVTHDAHKESVVLEQQDQFVIQQNWCKDCRPLTQIIPLTKKYEVGSLKLLKSHHIKTKTSDRQNNCILQTIATIVSSIANGKFILCQNEYNLPNGQLHGLLLKQEP